jgi:hypothetical protein
MGYTAARAEFLAPEGAIVGSPGRQPWVDVAPSPLSPSPLTLRVKGEGRKK